MLALRYEKGLGGGPFFLAPNSGRLNPQELSRKFDAGLGAGDQTRDIRPVLQQNEDGDEHGSQRDKFRRRMARRVQDINEDRQRYGCGERTQRRIAPENYHREPENKGGYYCFRANGKKNAKTGSHTFAATETQPDGKHVADDCEDRGCHHPADVAAGPSGCQPNGGVAFRGVEQQSENAGQDAGTEGDVCCADVAAARGANVRTAHGLHNKKTERYGTEQVGDDRNEPVCVSDHAAPSFTNENVASLEYSAPAGFRTLR